MTKKAGLDLVIGLVDEASSGLAKLQGNIKGIGLVAGGAAAAGLVALGKAAWDAGQTYDEVMDNFVTKTGASGETLDQLETDFKAVFTSIPTDAQTAGNAMAELSSQLGITGTTLQDLAKPLLEVSRITGGDAAANAQAFADIIGKWGIPVEEGALALDKLFVASQETGVDLAKLMDTVTKFGAPLQQFGMSFDEAVAVVAQFEQAGMNTEKAMGGLTAALGKFAKAGKDPSQALSDLVSQIQTAGTESEATKLAVENFGAKAGPELAAAIRSGKLSIDELLTTMSGAGGTIMETGAKTADFGEKWTVFKNKVTTALEPLGTKLLELATTVMTQLGPAFDWVMANGEKLVPVLVSLAAIIGTVLVAAFVSWAASATAAAAATIVALAPVLAPIAAIGAAVALLVAAWQNDWGGIQTSLTAIWTGTIQPVLNTLILWLQTNLPLAIATLTAIWTNTLMPALQAAWSWIDANLIPLITALARLLDAVLGLAVRVLAGIFENLLLPVLTSVWEIISNNLAPVFEDLKPLLEGVGIKLDELASGALAKVRGGFEDISNAVKSVIDWINRVIERLTAVKLPSWLGGGGDESGNATGSMLYRGGLTMVGERGPELVALPRNSRIYSASETQRIGVGGNTFTFAFAAPASAYDERQIEAAVERAMLRAGTRADTIRRTR